MPRFGIHNGGKGLNAMDEEQYERLRDDFSLLCEIIREPAKDQKLKADLSRIEKLIQEGIPEALKKNAPEDFYVLFTDFKAEYDRFRDFILYDKLIGKNIVALGGGFSSGKSSFLNALMGRNVLPEDIDPSTSVPTYIVRGDKHEAQGINAFDAQVTLNLRRRDLKKIAHGFGAETEEDDLPAEGVTLGHILKSIFFSTPLHKYDHIAFLDTPGYSKPDSEQYSAKTDEHIARGQLNASNFILWFVQADGGTIRSEDIEFIRSLREDIPKLVIVAKADKKNLSDLQEILHRVRTDLELKGIRYVDVRAFTSRRDQITDPGLGAFLDSEAEAIRKQLNTWDEARYESSFAWNFKKLFVRCRDYYSGEINEESRKLSRLNYSLTVLEGDAEAMEPLQRMKADYQKTISSLKRILAEVRSLQDAFFTEIKIVSDLVGIEMPEPGEIDLLEAKVRSPLQLIEDYRKKHNLSGDPAILAMLQKTFANVQPVINKKAGGSEYRAELERLIRASCGLPPERVHIHDALKRTEEYRKRLASLSAESVREPSRINEPVTRPEAYRQMLDVLAAAASGKGNAS